MTKRCKNRKRDKLKPVPPKNKESLKYEQSEDVVAHRPLKLTSKPAKPKKSTSVDRRHNRNKRASKRS